MSYTEGKNHYGEARFRSVVNVLKLCSKWSCGTLCNMYVMFYCIFHRFCWYMLKNLFF